MRESKDIERCSLKLHSVSGQKLHTIGKIKLTFVICETIFHYTVAIKGLAFPENILIGADLMKQLGIMSFNWRENRNTVKIDNIEYSICIKSRGEKVFTLNIRPKQDTHIYEATPSEKLTLHARLYRVFCIQTRGFTDNDCSN